MKEKQEINKKATIITGKRHLEMDAGKQEKGGDEAAAETGK